MRILTRKNTITDFVSEVADIKVFKPVQKIFVKMSPIPGHAFIEPDLIYQDVLSNPTNPEFHPKIRCRLIDTTTGLNDEIISETSLHDLSELVSKREGFTGRIDLLQPFASGDSSKLRYYGEGHYLFALNNSAALNLSNLRYLSVELTNLRKGFKYEVFGYELANTSSLYNKYTKMFLAPKELEKNFSVGNSSYLAIPIALTKEIQFFAKNSDNAPVYLPEELALDQQMSNDLTFLWGYNSDRLGDNYRVGEGLWEVAYDSCTPLSEIVEHLTVGDDGIISTDVPNIYHARSLPFTFAAGKYSLINLSEFKSFSIKRVDNDERYELFLIDVKG